MDVVIISEPGDYHAHAVAWGLRARGHGCDIVFLTDLPEISAITIEPFERPIVNLSGAGGRVDLSRRDRYWFRRPSGPVLPRNLHPSDVRIARAYWDFTVESALQIFGASAFCVNPSRGNMLSPLKPLHLSVARQAGLAIPPTMITSSSEDALSFIAGNRELGFRTIVKPLYASAWHFEDGGAASCGTELVEEKDIDEKSLRLAPCIFQAEQAKRSEVRLTILGGTILAAELDSQATPESSLDFRLIHDWNALGCRSIDTPPEIASSVLKFNKQLGLNFGTMDFIIDQHGQWLFLETNPMGNFLWVEGANPEVPLLDAMVEFIISGDDDFEYQGPRDDRLTLSDFETDVGVDSGDFLAAELQWHVENNVARRVLDRALVDGGHATS